MNTTDYILKIKQLLEEDAYKKTIIPREKSSECPKLYELPKIQKPNVPLYMVGTEQLFTYKEKFIILPSYLNFITGPY